MRSGGLSLLAIADVQGRPAIVHHPEPVPVAEGVLTMATAELAPLAPGPELLVVGSSGTLRIWNQQQRRLLEQRSVVLTRPVIGAAVGDFDLDGMADIALLTDSRLQVLAGDEACSWGVDGYFSGGLAAGQVDADPQLELVSGDGRVFDGLQQQLQWRWNNGFGELPTLHDVDGDGRDELICQDRGHDWIWCWDLDTGLPKWTLSVPERVRAFAVVDQDGDRALELLTKPDQWGSVRSYDLATRQQEWAQALPAHVETSGCLAAADLDGDGRLEVVCGVWGQLYVLDGNSHAIATVSLDTYDFRIVGRADVDGDAQPETVAVAQGDVWRQALLLVLDAATLVERQRVEPGPDLDRVQHAVLADLDGDAAAELVAIANGRLLVYDCSPARQWTLTSNQLLGSLMQRLCVADVAPTAGPELLLAGSTGVQVLAWPSRTLLWQSLPLPSPAIDLQVVDGDGDADLDVLVACDQGVVYAFDAGTHALWGALQAPAGRRLTSFTVPAPGLWLFGDDLGGVGLATPSLPGFAVLGPLPVSQAPIDCLGVLPGLPWLVLGSGGELRLQNGLQPAFRGRAFDPAFGRDFLLVPEQLGLLGAGRDGLYLCQPR